MKENRGILARLMAVENITVEHQHISTASFDVVNRVLTLPTWKEMSEHLYDMLRAHEVGHALETPAQGWHGTVLKDRHLRSFLNVVEDARIEKLVKNRYPGIRPSFVKGYKELFDQDFFGVQNKDLNGLLLIDRINLHFKVGSYLNVPFSSDEIKFVRRIEQINTWDEVVAIAKELFSWDEKALEEHRERMQQLEQDLLGDFGDGDFDLDGAETDEFGNTKSKKQEQDTKAGRVGTGRNTAPVIADSIDDSPPLDDWYDEEIIDNRPESLTDKFFRERESLLLDSRSLPFSYTELPEANLGTIITDHKTVAKQFVLWDQQSYKTVEKETKHAEVKAAFLSKNKKFIDHMASEFELRRNARQLARAGTSKTGALNLKRVHQYKLTDDLFQRLVVVPKGKSHGMIMIFDQSGSMGRNYSPTLEQIVVLAMFCRRIKLPFHVYGFSDSVDQFKQGSRRFDNLPETFSKKNGQLCLADNARFRLREYFNHTQSLREFNEMVDRIIHLSICYEKLGGFSGYIPYSERLSGTPLNEAIASLIHIVPEFRKAHKLDIVNTIVLTDGQGNTINQVYNNTDRPGVASRRHFYTKNNGGTRIVVRDPKTKIETNSIANYNTNDNSVTIALLKLLNQVTGSRTIGYFIGDNNRYYLRDWYASNGYIPEQVVEQGIAESKKNGFILIKDFETTGYDAYYRVSSKALDIGDENFDEVMKPDKSFKHAEIRKAFAKFHGDKRKQRLLLGNFVGMIA